MYQQILTSRSQPVVTPAQVASFGRFALPAESSADYANLLVYIEAATNKVESLAATACLNEEVLETYDYFPGQDDLRNQWALTYQYITNSAWWFGFPRKDSIALVRRPVLVTTGSPVTSAVTVQYNAPDGSLQTLDPASYTVFANKITLNVGYSWPATDRREDCVQITYWAGYSPDDPTQVPAELLMAIMYLSTHFFQVRQVVSTEPTTEVGMTLCSMLSRFKSLRIPR